MSNRIDLLEICRREAGLPKVLGVYQLAMVAVGAIISYGLLSGGAFPLNRAGSSVILSYAFASVLMLLMAYCLSEMASRYPTPGAFGSYAESYLGSGCGFLVRSSYVIGLFMIIGTEAVLLGQAAAYLVPGVSSVWISVLGLLTVIGVNLLRSQWFALLECVLSTVKIAALLFFIFLSWKFFFFHDSVSQAQQPLHDSWFLSLGSGTFVAFVLAVLGYAGMESAAVAAGETAASTNAIRRAIRVTASLIATLAVLVLVSSVMLGAIGALPFRVSPTLFLLHEAGISSMWLHVMTFIAVMSVINSQLYSASRMLFSLGRAEPRLQWLGLLHGDSPRIAVLSAGIASLLIYAIAHIYPYQTFSAATSIASTCLLLVWLMVFFSYLRFCKQEHLSCGTASTLPAWPAWFGTLMVLAVIVLIWELPAFALTLQIGASILVLLWLMHRMYLRMR